MPRNVVQVHVFLCTRVLLLTQAADDKSRFVLLCDPLDLDQVGVAPSRSPIHIRRYLTPTLTASPANLKTNHHAGQLCVNGKTIHTYFSAPPPLPQPVYCCARFLRRRLRVPD